MYKYVAIDLDGTLLKSNHEVAERSINVLRKLQEHGIVVMLCSGRNITNMNFVATKIDMDKHNTYIVSDNGGGITKLHDGKRTVLKNAKFANGEHQDIIKMLDKKTKYVMTFNDGKQYMKNFYAREFIRAYKMFGEMSYVGTPKEVSKILLIDKVEKIEKIYDDVKKQLALNFPHVNVFRSVPKLIEITPNGSTKGLALKEIFTDNNWDLKDLIVFGDGENDISMFEVAGLAVAMENGFDTVKSCADDICESNDADGVVQYLENIYSKVLEK